MMVCGVKIMALAICVPNELDKTLEAVYTYFLPR